MLRTLLISALVSIPLYQLLNGKGGDSVMFYAMDGETPADLEDDYGATLHFENNGPSFCVTGANTLTVFADDTPRQGCEIPAGQTSAGSPSSCPYHMMNQNQSFFGKYSRELNNWTAVGTSVVSTSTTSWYSDSRQLYKITDDDAGSHEYIEQTITKPPGGSYPRIHVMAATETGTGKITVEYEEVTGASCTNPLHTIFNGSATSTTMTLFVGYAYYTDANCSDITIRVYPVAKADGVGETGHVVANVWTKPGSVEFSFCETGASTVSCGNDDLWYTGGKVADNTSLPEPFEMSFNYLPLILGGGEDWASLWNGVGGGGSVDARINMAYPRKPYLAVNGVTEIAAASSQTINVGSSYPVLGHFDTGADYYELFWDGSSLGTSSTTYSQLTGITGLYVGSRSGNPYHGPGNSCFSSLTVYRP